MFKLKSELTKQTISNLRGGKGDLGREDLFVDADVCGKTKVVAILTIPDGCSIGEHAHGPDAELYYIMSGTLRITDNGVTKDLVVGDSVFTCGGNAHCVENVSGKDAQLLSVIIA